MVSNIPKRLAKKLFRGYLKDKSCSAGGLQVLEGGRLVSQPALCLTSSSSYSKGDVPMSLRARFTLFLKESRLDSSGCLSEVLSYE